MNRGLPLLLVALPFVSGCVLWLRDVEEAPKPPVAAEGGFARTGDAVASERWWESFQDPGLNRAVDGVLTGNLDLRRAWARLEQASAILDGADASYWPQINANAELRRNRQAFPFGAFLNTSYPLGLSASYEVDVWGRVAASSNAAELEFEATRQDLEAAAMTLAAQVTEAWFNLSEQHAQVALAKSQIDANRTALELVELRFEQGLVSALDVYQQRQLLVGSEAQLPLAEGRLEVARHQLAVLLGRPPREATAAPAGALPDPPPLPATGVAADLLERRPDLRAAAFRVAAADYRVAAAIANRLPTIRLSASTGFNAFWDASPFSNWIWSLAAGLTAPIFDGGRLSAEQDRNEAVMKELVAGYGQTLLVAMREVEDALVQEDTQRRHLEQLVVQTEVASAALREARERYTAGLSDYLPVLTAMSAHQAAQRSELAARRLLLSYRVQLHRALGGHWTQALSPPEEERVERETPTAGEPS